jgi:osmotically-inducible protein OsmY
MLVGAFSLSLPFLHRQQMRAWIYLVALNDPPEDAIVRDDINTTAADLKAVAQDMLRMGRHWTQAAQGWLHAQAGSTDGTEQAGFRGVGPRGYIRSDERIREDISDALTEADDIDASGITVEVGNGVATLGGRVEQRWMKHRAEDLADACIGVRDVRNNIQVGSAGATAGT